MCTTTSHPLKERKREPGKLTFLYETNVLTWSSSNFVFKYHASEKDSTFCRHRQQLVSIKDICFPYIYLQDLIKAQRKEVVFVVDISESIKGNIMEVTKNTVGATLLKLDQDESFGIIAFNDQIHLFSSTLELATRE